MDVLTHAIEALVSTGANDFSDALAEKAIALVWQHLPDVFSDENNIAASGPYAQRLLQWPAWRLIRRGWD
ncbi:bifunctional acetaldehyde-CoA/alcohol dehydrogenase [Raoultella planticola]|uniref:Bifunctional acetaldehyde-CoA/alcohol dehydrogenase n=1 Tax=Raoultella planticola TaxID=575 RepID=A0A485AVR1_RAOPL|nr:bifunctional acetaldehyde-CoA/alcohol dehydrogenase [Raoultella planticola]